MSLGMLIHKRLLPLTLFVALGALAADTHVDAGKSTITATFKQEGVPVEAAFRKFTGNIQYDPAKPAAATAVLEVDTGSFDMGDESYNDEVRKKAWFDSTAYPKATFRSTQVKPGAADKFDATGALTIKGKVATITLPITVKRVGNTATYSGNFVVSRAMFGIGDPSWNDVLDDKVSVRFNLVTPES
ncbi:MAG: YceI family protein [Steroidobacteraceae bacterium]